VDWIFLVYLEIVLQIAKPCAGHLWILGLKTGMIQSFSISDFFSQFLLSLDLASK
jgi:hypothetical protein